MSIKCGVKKTGDKLGSLMSALKHLTNREVMVGIPEDAAARDDTKMSNAAIGYIMETGSPAQNIPERPWLVPGVETVQDETVKDFKKAAEAALDGSSAGVDRALNRAGLRAQSAVKNYIVNGEFEKLAPSTIAARNNPNRSNPNLKNPKPTRSGEKPLIDTSQMIGAVTYVVRDKGKES